MDGSRKPELRGQVALLRLEVAQDGRISATTLTSLAQQLDDLNAVEALGAVVLTGAGGRFSVGADFKDLMANEGSTAVLASVADRLSGMSVPTVAALSGPCLGSAAELALACRYRIAGPETKIGFPDVMVGLPPAAGATKRLPRLIGADRALKMLLNGRPVSAEDALKIGLVDQVTENDPVEAALALVADMASDGEIPRTGSNEDGSDFLRAVTRHRGRAASAPIEAPARIVECVEAGRIVPDEIFANMQEVAFEDLWTSSEAKSLAHIDAIEREAAKLQRLVKPKANAVERVAIAGTRGNAVGLAIAALEAGYDVTLAETDEEALEAGAVQVIEHFDALVADGRMTEAASEAVLDRIHAVSGLRTLVNMDLVFDVVNARGAASKSLIRELDRVMQDGAVLVTGSTQVGPDAIAGMTGRAEDVLAVRFSGTSAERRVVEVTPGSTTDAVAVGTVISVLTRMRRLPVVTAPNIRGVGARLMYALHATADHLLEQGASIAAIDQAAEGWGLPLGSYGARDARGIVAPSPKTSDPGASLGLDRVLAAQGRKGKVAGRGYYSYAGGKKSHDPNVSAMVDALRARKGITPRAVSEEEIRISLIAAMANAGAAILGEGGLARPAQIDLLTVHALGLSRRAGGVMNAADLVGLDVIRARLKALAEEAQALPGPHPMFQELVSSGRRFRDLNA